MNSEFRIFPHNKNEPIIEVTLSYLSDDELLDSLLSSNFGCIVVRNESDANTLIDARNFTIKMKDKCND